MTKSFAEREKIWDDFLARWPLETLESMTLEQYTKAGDPNAFVNWLESRTESLGSIWGGSSFKFGIYARKDKVEKHDGGGLRYTDEHAWYEKYGSSAGAAFSKVRSLVAGIARAARDGDLSAIDKIDLGDVTKWKIAFLYQDRSAPTVLPVYLARRLREAAGVSDKNVPVSALQSLLMGQRGGMNVLRYGEQFWSRGKSAGAEPEDGDDGSGTGDNEDQVPPTPPVNRILYGPPGTGKTHATIDEALQLLAPDYYDAHREHRSNLKAKFDELHEAGQIEFVTFHQSFSYEDFVEGLRAQTGESDGTDAEAEGSIRYVVAAGVFKRLCDEASKPKSVDVSGDIATDNPTIWKLSIDGTGSSKTRDYCFTHEEARIGWGELGDARKLDLDDPKLGIGPNDRSSIRNFSQGMQKGDIILCIRSVNEAAAIGVVVGDYRFEPKGPAGVHELYNHVLPVKWLQTKPFSILRLNAGVKFTLKTAYPLGRFNWGDLLRSRADAGEPVVGASGSAAVVDNAKPFVLVIDEINRGNVSRIFGELITLIEPSKRRGQPEALSTTLPYSKTRFWIPSNVHLLGTMNTADRSLTQIDIALRRRFEFKEMPPRPDLLDEVDVAGINIGAMLRVMNERIEVLLDRDHCLGHTYFLDLKAQRTLPTLAHIFRQKVLPLLQEYFFEDWGKIELVLNDHRKHDKQTRFVHRAESDLTTLFGDDVDRLVDRRWRLNDAAFTVAGSYLGIIGAKA